MNNIADPNVSETDLIDGKQESLPSLHSDASVIHSQEYHYFSNWLTKNGGWDE